MEGNVWVSDRRIRVCCGGPSFHPSFEGRVQRGVVAIGMLEGEIGFR